MQRVRGSYSGGCRYSRVDGHLEALEAVCNHDGQLQVEMLDGIQALVSKSLLQQREGADGEPRFWMLETILEYAREKLQESGEAEPLYREHALYFMKLAEEAEPHLTGAKQVEWLNRLEEEHDNLRALLKWSIEHGKEGDLEAANIGLRVVGVMWRFWEMRGYNSEGRGQLARFLSLSTTGDYEKAQRTRALLGAGILAQSQGDYVESTPLLEEALALGKETGDEWSIAFALSGLGNVAGVGGDYQTAQSLYEENSSSATRARK